MSSYLVTGGAQRGRAIWYDEFHHYKEAILARVDMTTGHVEVLLRYESPPHLAPADKPSIVFKCASLQGDRLILTTQTEVLVHSWPGMKRVAHLSHPSLNDVHHALAVGEEIWVVSTGLDIITRFAMGGEVVGFLPTVEEAPFTRFDQNKDYRLVPSTKPHLSHPNFIFERDGEIWVTRCNLRDAACLKDLSRVIGGFPERIHDGNPQGENLYFTTVNGHVIQVDGKSLAITKDYDLSTITGSDAPLGWCRGLALDGQRAVVGFSRIRGTKLHDNLRWLKNKGKPKTFQPTRIAEFDLEGGALLREVNLEGIGMAAVFSVLEIPTTGAM